MSAHVPIDVGYRRLGSPGGSASPARHIAAAVLAFLMVAGSLAELSAQGRPDSDSSGPTDATSPEAAARLLYSEALLERIGANRRQRSSIERVTTRFLSQYGRDLERLALARAEAVSNDVGEGADRPTARAVGSRTMPGARTGGSRLYRAYRSSLRHETREIARALDEYRRELRRVLGDGGFDRLRSLASTQPPNAFADFPGDTRLAADLRRSDRRAHRRSGRSPRHVGNLGTGFHHLGHHGLHGHLLLHLGGLHLLVALPLRTHGFGGFHHDVDLLHLLLHHRFHRHGVLPLVLKRHLHHHAVVGHRERIRHERLFGRTGRGGDRLFGRVGGGSSSGGHPHLGGKRAGHHGGHPH